MPSIDNIFGAAPSSAGGAAASSPSIDNIFGGTPATPSVDNIFANIAKPLDMSGSKIASNLSPGLTPPAITAPKPADTSNIFQKFVNGVSSTVGAVGSAINKAITPPDAATVGKDPSQFNRTLSYLPSELARSIPGVADLQDSSDTKATAADPSKLLPYIQTRGKQLQDAKTALDISAKTLDSSNATAVKNFNAQIDQYNASVDAYSKNITLYNGAVDTYAKQKPPDGVTKVSLSDFGNAIPKALGDAALGFVKAPITAVADAWDLMQTNLGKNPDASFTIPGLGKITSDQIVAAQRIQNGEDPLAVAMSQSAGGIFNVLFFADVVNRVTGPRTVTVGKTTGNINDLPKVGTEYRPTVDAGPKTGRLYEPPTAYNKGGAQVLPKPMLDTMASQGIKLGSAFKPEQPVFFKLTVGKGGAYTGEIIQLKPSFLQAAITKVFGTKGTAPENTVSGLLGAAPDTPATGINPADLGPIADSAQSKDTTVIHSQTVQSSDIVKAVQDATSKMPPEKTPLLPPPTPTTSHVVAHNTIRLAGGDTSSAPDHAKVLLESTQKAIAVHGAIAVHQALMDQLGMGHDQATALIKEAQTPQTAKAQNATIDAHIDQQLASRTDEEITAQSNAHTDKNLESLTDSYLKEHGNVVGADEAKEFIPGYSQDRSTSDLVQRAAGKIADHAYDRLLDTKQGTGNNTVLITAGGTGAGKSTSIREVDTSKFPVVFDTNLSNAKGGIDRIQKALDKGYDVDLRFTYTRPDKAYDRVLDRAEQLRQKDGSGRPVSAQGHLDMHHGSHDALPEIIKHFEKEIKEGRVGIKLFDNSGMSPVEAKDPLDFITKVRDNRNNETDYHTQLNDQRKLALHEGRISNKTNAGFDRAEALRPRKEGQGVSSRVQESGKKSPSKSPNPLNRGFVNPEQIAKDTAAAIKRVQETIKEFENIRELSGDIRDAGYQHENKRVANRQRLINLANDVGNMLDATGWNDLYHYDENSEEKITPEEKAIYDGVIKPLKDSLSNIITEYKTLGGHMDAELFFMENEGYTPRFAKDKGGAIDKIIDDFKALGEKAKKTLQNGGLLSKSLGTVDKSRKFFALTDEKGTRSVVHIPTNKSQQVLGFNKGKITELGKPNSTRNSKLLNEQLKPVKKRIDSLQKTVQTLKSVRTREPVSETRLTNLKNRIEELKATIKQNTNTAHTDIHASMNRDIESLSKTIDTFETKYKTLKPFEQKSPAVAKELSKIEDRLGQAYESESNLALSDVYEQISEIADKSDEVSEKAKADLQKISAEYKTLSKVKSADKVVLTAKRIATLEKKIVEASNAMADIEGTYNPESLHQKSFVDKEGNRYSVSQATTKEIEAHTKVRYHTNVLANYLVALDRATNALNAMKLLERIKNEDEFGDIIRKDNPDEATPEGWKSVGDILPQFRGYHLEPRTAEVLTDLANRQKGQLHIPVIDEINNFLVGAIVFNPAMHIPNVIAGRSTAAAALGVPAKSLANLARAYTEVKNAGPLYLSYLEHGAPFMALKATTKNFTDAILTQYTDEIENEKDPGFLDEHQQLANLLGYTNPAALARGLKHLNETMTWGSNDVLFMHALMDYQDMHGGSMEEAIKAVSKYMADYRIPERILLPGQAGRVLSQALQSRAFLFGRFHYTGVIRPWLESMKDSAGPGSTGKQRQQGLRALAYMLIMGLIAWPYVNKMWQGISGSSTTYDSMPGPLRPIQVAQKLAQQGPAGVPAALNSVFTVSPVLRSMIELGFNVDLFTRNPIYGNLPAEGLSAYGTSVVSPLASASRMNPGDFTLSLFGIWTPKNVPAKTTLTTMKYDELPALQTQVKKDIASGNQAKANTEMAEFNTRAIATWNQYELQTGGTDLVTTDAQKQAFLKDYGIKEPGAVALAHANTLYGDGSLTAKSSLISNIATYAKAVGVSPAEAFHLIFSGQTIARVDNFSLFGSHSAIIVQRAPLSYTEPIKQGQEAAQGKTNDNSTLELDHVLPLEAGGTNDESNLNLITTAQNMGEQHVFENALGDAVKAGTITQAQVREYSIRYKVGQGETLPDQYMKEFTDKYGGKTMTLQEVQDAIAGK